MCRSATIRVLGALALAVPASLAQGVEWRQVGNAALLAGLPSVGTGPIERVWFSFDGGTLFARTVSGRTFSTTDFEHWTPRAGEIPPDATSAVPPSVPEPRARIRATLGAPARLYAVGQDVHRSDDGGANWNNTTAYEGRSILGGPVRDAVISPRDPDEVVVAGERGVWRSLDGGSSWTGLNSLLPNLPVFRILRPRGPDSAMIIALADRTEWMWQQGERLAWRPSQPSLLDIELQRSAAIAVQVGVPVSASAASDTALYAGSVDGRLWSSIDRGQTWRMDAGPQGAGTVARIWADPRDPQFAVAIVGSKVMRTNNGGQFWDDLTGNLPAAMLRGIAADHASNTLYAAGDGGLFFSNVPGQWTLLRAGPVADVALDDSGNQLFAAIDGQGLIGALAPHRLRDPRVVSAADFTSMAAAPGALMSVLGGRVTSATAGSSRVAVLAATPQQSQIQIPFEVRAGALALSLEMSNGRMQVPLSLKTAAPVIFLDQDGAPMLLNSDTGLLLDASTPARSGTRVQILATGLGLVRPEWPTGVAAPLEGAPQVVLPVRVFLDRSPVPVTRATLAPGYVGFYLVEIELPTLVNTGTAELYLDVEGQESNRVRIFLDN